MPPLIDLNSTRNGNRFPSISRTKPTPKLPPLPIRTCDLENLRASGLTDQTIRANGLYSLTVGDAAELASILNRGPRSHACMGGLVFPFRDIEGREIDFARVRPHLPLKGKYLSPTGEPNRAYFPWASLPKLRDGRGPIFITEGEKKALALSQLGLAAIGLAGIWCGCQKTEDGNHDLLEFLKQVPWADRVVYIVFDHDEKFTTRREAYLARQRLANVLKAAGAEEVYTVTLPPGPDGAKNGVDDYLVAQGSDAAKAFDELIEAAILTSTEQSPGINSINSGGASSGINSNDLINSEPPTLGEDAYHGFLGEFLKAVSPLTEATDACILAHLIAAIGTVFGPDIHAWGGKKQPTRFNMAIVGPTARGRKGTGFVPVDQLMSKASSEFWEGQPCKGLSSGEGLVAKVADRVHTDSEGNETVTEVEKRVLVVEEEFSKVLANTRREGNVLSQIMRECWDNGDLETMTVKPRKVKGAHISIVGHITPLELERRFLEIEMANGFGNRFLWFYVKSDKSLPRSKPIPSVLLTPFAQRLQRICSFVANWRSSHTKPAHVFCPPPIGMDDEAATEWDAIYGSFSDVDHKPGFVGPMLSRGSSQVLRLALLYALLDEKYVISMPHLRAALAVWAYNVASVELLFGKKSMVADSLEKKLLKLLENGPLTTKEFYAKTGKSAGEIQPALDALVKQGLITRAEESTGRAGRPAIRWSRAESPTK